MIFEIAHQIGLIPILIMMVAGRKLPRAYWLVAVAFFISWLGDSAMHFSGGTWQIWYIGIPLQVWIVLAAFTRDRANLLLAAVALMMMVPSSWMLSAPGPDMLVTAAGSIAILLLAHGWLKVPVYLYFGAGTVAYLVMASMASGSGTDFMPAWYCYQGCRAISMLAFATVIIAPLLIRKLRGGPDDAGILV